MILPYLAIALLILATAHSAFVAFRPTGKNANWLFPKSASRFSRMLVTAFTVVFFAGAAFWMGTSARPSTRPASRFLIPEGYTGWVRIEFDVPGAPALPTQEGQDVFRIPAQGTLRTSSPEQYGWAKDRYYYDSVPTPRPLPDSGPTALIWGKINGEASGISGKRKYQEFFVGTAQQFKAQGSGNADRK